MRKNLLRSLLFCALAGAAALSRMWPNEGAAAVSGRAAPEIGGENWLNSKPLTIGELRGRVVLVEFWTYG